MAINDKLNRIKEIKEDIKQALIDKGVEVTDEDSFGSYADKITNIPQEGGGDPYYEDLYNARTSNGTNMAGLFSYMTGDNVDLTRVDVSQCTKCDRMFAYININNLDITGWEFSNTTSTQNFFESAFASNVIGLSDLKFPKLTELYRTFYSAHFNYIDLSGWDVNNITKLDYTFAFCEAKKIDLTGWNTNKVTYMSNAFNYMNNLTDLIIPDWDMTNVTNSNNFIKNADELKYIDLSRSNDLTINKIITFIPTRTESDYGEMKIPADSSQELIDALIAKYWKPIGPVFNVESFQISSELDEVILGQKTRIVCHSQVPWQSNLNNVEFISSDESIATVNENGEITAVSLGSVEIYARLKDNPDVISNTISFTVAEVDSTPYVIKFKSAASTPVSSAYYIDVNGNSIKLNTMDYNPHTKIYTCDVGQEITSIEFNSAYSMISDLIKLDFNGNNIQSLRINSGYIKSIDTTSWDTSNITNMNSMFDSCTSVSTIDASNWDTSNVTSMSFLFQNCTSLTMLDLTSWDTSQVLGTFYMFLNVPSTCQIYVGPNWTLTESECSFTGTFIRTNKLTINYQDSYEPYNNPYVEFSTTLANENSKRCYLTEETEFGRRGYIYLPNNKPYWIHCSNNNETYGTLSSSITLESEKEIWIVHGEPWYFEEEPNTGVGGDYITGFDVDPTIDSFVFDKVDNRTLNLNIYPYEQGKQVSFSISLEDSTFANSDTLWPSIDTYEYDMGYNNVIYCSVNLQISDDLGSATLVIGESNSGIEKRISVSVAEPQPKITDFTISPESLTFSDDGAKTATVTVIPAETDRAVRFSYSYGSQSQFSITLDESEAPNKYYFHIEATQLYKEEYEPVFSVYEERSGISKSVPVTIDSENIWVNPQAFITVYYYREDGDYNNAQLAYSIPSESSSGSTGFWNSNDNGQYAGQWFLKGQEVELRVFNGWDPDDGSELIVASGTFTFTEDTELWVVDGDSTIYTEKPSTENPYRVEYTLTSDSTGIISESYLPSVTGTYKLKMILNDGTETEDTSIDVSNVSKFVCYLEEDVTSFKFGDSTNKVLKTIEYIKLPSGVTSLQNMMQPAKSLTYMNVEHLNTENITNMNGLFAGCGLLTSLDLSSWDVSNLQSAFAMFAGCSGLQSLNLTNWNISKNFASMFLNVPSTCVITVSDSLWTLTEEETGFTGTFTRV